MQRLFGTGNVEKLIATSKGARTPGGRLLGAFTCLTGKRDLNRRAP